MIHSIQGRAAATPERFHHHDFQSDLADFNARRLTPHCDDSAWQERLRDEARWKMAENAFVEAERAAIDLGGVPREPAAFMAWFENLRAAGPGQGDALFPWLARSATLEQMKWFLTQEAAGEAGFEELVALTQVKLPARPKLEMARNYWDEMGRGHERGMHGPMLADTVRLLELAPRNETTCWESLALANLMTALAANRRFAYQSAGALGVIEMTAPGRVALVNDGLRRLGVPTAARKYFQLHAGLDIEHSKAWNAEVIAPLVEADPALCLPIAEGALLRLRAGARCFRRYRAHFLREERDLARAA